MLHCCTVVVALLLLHCLLLQSRACVAVGELHARGSGEQIA